MTDHTMISPIPVTILTGFLGAGKTTLLNHFLMNANDLHIAVIENEFAAINIDSNLLHQSPTTQLVSLENGCVCCTISAELTAALDHFAQLNHIAQSQQQKTFDHLIIETTGLADPGAIIQAFFTNESHRERFVLDAVITLVDMAHIDKQLAQHPVCAQQIGFADRLILTKMDHVTATQIEMTMSRLQHINAKAVIVTADHGRINADQWLHLHAFHLNSQSPLASTKGLGNFRTKPSFSDHIRAHVLKTSHPLDLDRISHWMEKLLASSGNDLLRYKGILYIHQKTQRLIVQGVYKVVGFDYAEAWRNDETPHSIFVLIGRDLPIDTITADFHATTVLSSKL